MMWFPKEANLSGGVPWVFRAAEKKNPNLRREEEKKRRREEEEEEEKKISNRRRSKRRRRRGFHPNPRVPPNS